MIINGESLGILHFNLFGVHMIFRFLLAILIFSNSFFVLKATNVELSNNVKEFEQEAFLCFKKQLYKDANDIHLKIISDEFSNSCDKVVAYNNAAINYLYLGNTEKAIESLLKAGSVSSCSEFSFQLSNNLMVALISNGNKEKIKEYIEVNSDQIDSSSFVIHYNIGQWYLQNQNVDLAKNYFYSNHNFNHKFDYLPVSYNKKYVLAYIANDKGVNEGLLQGSFSDSSLFKQLSAYNIKKREFESLSTMGMHKQALEIKNDLNALKDKVDTKIYNGNYLIAVKEYEKTNVRLLKLNRLYVWIIPIFVCLAFLGIVRFRRKYRTI